MWLLYCLGIHQDHQQTIHDEIDAVLDDPNEEITPDTLAELTFLDRFVKESQRMYPSVPVVARKLEEPLDLGALSSVHAYNKKIYRQRCSHSGRSHGRIAHSHNAS